MHLRSARVPDRSSRRSRAARARDEGGFAMIVALVVLVVGMLLAAAAFSAVNEDSQQTRTYIVQQKAYAAAQAALQEFKYELGANSNYWSTCPKTVKPLTVPGTTDETYTYRLIPSEKHTQAECEAKKEPALIETSGSANGTFRVEATGSVPGKCGEKALKEKGFTENANNKACTRSIVATFTHPGFINYVFVSNYEILDPVTESPEPTDCEEYYKERTEKKVKDCTTIVWRSTDKVNGPFHTNDGADTETGSSFGREGDNDAIEMNQGHYGGTPSLHGTGFTEEAGTLLPPETDGELLETAETGYKFKGRTSLVLEEGSPNKIKVTKWTSGKEETETKSFPSNGVIYVEDGSKGCGISYTPFGSKYIGDTECGNAYVRGQYSESLTIGAANDVIVDGNTTTTGGSSGGEPTGTATLGLIATNFVRVYHPVKGENGSANHEFEAKIETGKLTELKEVTSFTGVAAKASIEGPEIPSGDTVSSFNAAAKTITLTEKAKKEVKKEAKNKFKIPGLCGSKTCENTSATCNEEAMTAAEAEKANELSGAGSPSNIIVDGAILSTKHSWIVDNYLCGASLGTLTVWGSIAQFWRGPVGRSPDGYATKNYNYDERLKTNQPPSFLSPTTTGAWKVERETAPPE